MRKKRNRKNQPKAKRPAPVQFRIGEACAAALQKFADEQNMSANVAAKCLVALAVNGLGVRHFLLVQEFATATGGTFERVCGFVALTLQIEVHNRAQNKLPPLDENSRQLFATAVLTQLTNQFR